MDLIFLSSHLDDVAYSCWGLVWDLSRSGENVHIWTICAGEPESGNLSPFAREFHQRWKTGPHAVRRRIEEDQTACRILGAIPDYSNIPDCIYRYKPVQNEISVEREYLYQTEEQIFSEIHPAEASLVESLTDEITARFNTGFQLVCPLTVGGHVDHRLVRKAAEKSGYSLLYYAEFPYIREDWVILDKLESSGWKPHSFKITSEGIAAWQAAAAAYQSQVTTFWESTDALEQQIKEMAARAGGTRLFEKS